MALTHKQSEGRVCLASYSRFKSRAIANSKCRHMKELKQKALGQPRAIRRSKDAISRIEAVRAKRNPIWPGDRMLLAKLNNSTPDNVKNYCEEKARLEAKYASEAGGQALEDWEAAKRTRKRSHKYAGKMWAEYNRPGNKDVYLQKLENGLISLETGETINGDSSQQRGSALNPANGYIQSIPDIVHASKGTGQAGVEGTRGGAASNAYTMGHVMRNEADYHSRYDSIAGSSQYLIHKRGLFRCEDDVEHDFNQRLSPTNGSLKSFDSQMAYNFKKYPAFNDVGSGVSKPRPALLEYKGFDLQTMSQHGRPMPASMQPFSHETCTSTMLMGFQPSPVGPSSNMTDKLLRQGGWQYRQEGRPAAATFEEQDKRASHVGLPVQKDRYEYPEPSQTPFTAPSEKRKQGLLEEETVDVRPFKRQRQLEPQLRTEQQCVSEQRFQLESKYNGHDGEGCFDEELEPELEDRFNFSGVASGEHTWHKYDWHGGDAHRITALDAEHHSHSIPDQGKEIGTLNDNANPEGRLETGSVASTENLTLTNTNRLPSDKPENAIALPEDDKGDEAARVIQSTTGNRASIVGKQATCEADVLGYLHEMSSTKGYTNAWYCQGLARKSEPEIKSPWQSGHPFYGNLPSISD
ncbi:105527c4-88c2-4f03-bdbc-dfdd0c22be5a [Sclerotinia trifoliorum]|uniref:105527c4-88c2-4f03-bdbc-dfdd0c22be5a n=1 Tax=Sclerotinia trifoliorum TaxID=28548 RepID=A0A8H2ZVR6_9HELO|nr:105527c4-88c2-4f03-bdbc-dfdd0c22be5a [Sclerotinia trifoliorum]